MNLKKIEEEVVLLCQKYFIVIIYEASVPWRGREGGREAAASAQSAQQVQQDHRQVISFTLPLKLIYLKVLLKPLFFESSTTAGSYCKFAPISPHSNVQREIPFTGAVKAAS